MRMTPCSPAEHESRIAEETRAEQAQVEEWFRRRGADGSAGPSAETGDATTAETVELALAAPPSAPGGEQASRNPHPSDPDHEASGGPLGPYEVIRTLGEGASARVYLARDARFRGLRLVALKVLRRGRALDPRQVRRLQGEADALARVRHPGLCALLDSGEAGGRPYLALEYAPGRTLAAVRDEDRRTRGEGPWQREEKECLHIAGWVREAAEALDAAHAVGVVHGDVTPANLMLDAEGKVICLDFGLAAVAGEREASALGPLSGTPPYLAPELFRGGGSGDPRADVWALGVVLYELLSGRRPFLEEEVTQLALAVQGRDAPDLRRLTRGAVPLELARVCHKALAREVEQRYATAGALAEDLGRAAAGLPVLARPLPWPVRALRMAARHRLVSGALALTLVVLVFGLVSSLRQGSRARERLRAAEALRSAAETREREARQQERRAREEESRASARRERAERKEKEVRELTLLLLAQGLLEESAALWPAAPARLPELRRWREEAKRLLVAGDTLRPQWEDLRAQLLQRERREAGPSMRREREEWIAALDPVLVAEEAEFLAFQSFLREKGAYASDRPGDAVIVGDLESGLEDVRRRRERWERELRQPTDDATRIRLGFLREFDEMLVRLRASLASVEKRIRRSEGMARAEAVERRRLAWQRLRADLARREGAYASWQGPLPDPIEHWLPLGKDRDSGLWELHVGGSGEVPTWEGEEGWWRRPDGNPNGRCPDRKELARGLVVVLLPGGRTRLGAQSHDPKGDRYDPLSLANEGRDLPGAKGGARREPLSVQLVSYYIGKCEVTGAQWFRAFGEDPSLIMPDGWAGRRAKVSLWSPVNNVNRAEAAEFCRRLGLGLPTEAQWEHAARGGTETPWWCGSERASVEGAGNVWDQAARHWANTSAIAMESWNDGYDLRAPVGAFAPNPFGLHDVIGNVAEWCSGAYSRGYPTIVLPGDGAFVLRPELTRAVARGGYFARGAANARSSYRLHRDPRSRQAEIGFRVARPAVPIPRDE
jgi:formylglycine-generating enzyme required for sulfatase activity/tRNA A-37 threonylcarbamoyl transferase component Bud32